LALDKQINMYSVDTGNFYSNRERYLHNKNAKLRREKNYVNNARKPIEKQLLDFGYTKKDISKMKSSDVELDLIDGSEDIVTEYQRLSELYKHKVDEADKIKDALLLILSHKVSQNELTNGKDHTRTLNETTVSEKNIISIFDSALTRIMGLEKDELTENLITVQVYYFDVFKDMSYFGFMYKGEKYKYLTSSAGQIRKKKAVFIKESVWNKYEKTIMCGLTIDKINSKGGNNVNKHLAYMALTNSATDEWEDFDIDKTIVIDDFETNVFGTYDLIDDVTYSITRESGSVPIPHSDGCGMILYGRNKMVRLPWVKGLLGVFDYISLIKENGWSPIIKDIYGKEHNIIEEDIQIIFTKSQFKMAKYYDSWDEYKEYFKQYNCKAGYCNEEETRIKDSKINYQELQTLTDTTDEDLEYMIEKSVKKLNNICKTREGLFNVFGITPYNTHPTPLQQAVKIYPNLLNDEYMKITIREIKNGLLKKYRAGKLEIDGKYTFLMPDFYAACEYWFGHIENPIGLLADSEVFCDLFRHSEKVDCLRSPHLYKEHAVRFNVASNAFPEKREKIKKWFTTSAIYTSCHDLISKILQFDVDGDHSLVIGDKRFIEIVEKSMRGIVPLYYNMKKAEPCELTPQNIYKGLNSAFTGGNIGIYSNNISKIWNSDIFVNGTDEEKQSATNIVKLLCMENNFTIDYAKTLYKPERPKHIDSDIKEFTRKKVPHFFYYAKDKEKAQVECKNNSLVNKLEDVIKDMRLDFRGLDLGKIDYRLLMNKPRIQVNQRVIDEYKKLNSEWHFKINMKDDEDNNFAWIAHNIREKLNEFGYSESEITDMLVKELYGKNNKRKESLWFCYGNYIVRNLTENIKPRSTKIIQCVDCGEWFEVDSSLMNKIRCNCCQHEVDKERKRIWKQNNKR
jgi:hypothetical protein